MTLLQSIRVSGTDRHRSLRPAGIAVSAISLLLLSPGLARAQAEAPVKDSEFSVQRFDPAPGPRNYFSTRGIRAEGHLAWSAGLVLNYANDPFVVVSCIDRTNCSNASAVPGRSQDVHVVQHLATANALGSLTLIDRLQLGLSVPVSYVSGDNIRDDGYPDADNPIRGVGLGDIMVEGKYRAYGESKDPFAVGGGVFLTAPLGHATAEGKYIGDGTPTAGIRAIFDGKQGPFSVGGNLGAAFRGTARVGSTELGSEFRYGVGAGFDASPVIRVILDGFGNTKFSSKAGTNSLEIDGGIQVTPLASPLLFMVGGGAGVIEGIGVPKFRAILGFMYVMEARDRDGDGIKDNDDQCPTEAEDKDGYEDSDGCPDKDNDGDTILDADDHCPLQAEDSDGFQDTDGCPDPDNDGDGVEDTRDQCPDKKETMNGFKDDDGCPDEPDKDGDGVPDAKDQCPDQAEDTDGFQDTDGCPDPDNDGDGINDEDDECVDEPETKNDYQDEDGCPDEPGKAAPAKAPKAQKPAQGQAPKPAAPAPKPATPAPAPQQ
jgi:OmpA-OmpF porin, OOP family